jgi:protein TonB
VRKVIVISAAVHLVFLVLLPLLPNLGPRQPLALEVYAVELVDVPNVEPVVEPPPEEPEEQVSEPVSEPPPEESPIPEDPTPQRIVRKAVPPPPPRESKTLEERLAERLKDVTPPRARDEEPRDEPEPRQPTGSTKITAGKVADYYLTMLQGKITRNWKQPSVRFAGGGALTVRVTFRVMRSGEVTALAIARSSGWSTVDQSAVQAVRASTPFAELPSSYTGGHLDVTIDFTVKQ